MATATLVSAKTRSVSATLRSGEASRSFVVAIASAALLLAEPIHIATVAGIVLLLSGVWLGRRPNQSDPPPRR
jgi:drug/metabolite transporter (DMT)-like permease